MQSDDCPRGVLAPVLYRIHLKELGSVNKYRKIAQKIGWQDFQVWEMPEQLINHYKAVFETLQEKHDQLLDAKVSRPYLYRMKTGLTHWIKAGERGYLNWGVFLLVK